MVQVDQALGHGVGGVHVHRDAATRGRNGDAVAVLDAKGFAVLVVHIRRGHRAQAAVGRHTVQAGVDGVGDAAAGGEHERIFLGVSTVQRVLIGGQSVQAPLGVVLHDGALELKLAGGGLQTLVQLLIVHMGLGFTHRDGQVHFLELLHGKAQIIQNVLLDKGLIALFQLLIGQVHVAGQLGDDVGVALGLAQGLDDRAGVPGRAAGVGFELAALKAGAGGQHDVGVLGGIGHEQVGIHKEVQALQGFEHPAGVGEHAGVHAQRKDSAERVGRALQDLAGHVHGLHLALQIVPQREAGSAHGILDVLRAGLVQVLVLMGFPAAANVHIAVGAEQLAALAVKVAGNGDQCYDGAVVLQAVAVMAQGGRGLVAADPLVLVDELGGLHHLAVGHIGQLLNVALVELADILCVLVEAVDVFVDVGLVDPAVLDQHVGNGVGQSAVGAGAGLEEQVGQLLAGGGAAGVHDEELQALFFQSHGTAGLHVRGVERIECPAQEQVAVGHIRPPLLTSCHFPGHKGSGVAGAGLTAVVGAAKSVGQAAEHLAVPLGVAGVERHALRAVLCLGGIQPLGDLGVSLVPGDGFKLALAALAHPLERGEDAILPVDVLAVGQALGAQAAIVGGVTVDALDLDNLAILDVGIDAAVHPGRADIAYSMAHLDARVRAGDLRLDLAFQFRHIVASSWSMKDSSRP